MALGLACGDDDENPGEAIAVWSCFTPSWLGYINTWGPQHQSFTERIPVAAQAVRLRRTRFLRMLELNLGDEPCEGARHLFNRSYHLHVSTFPLSVRVGGGSGREEPARAPSFLLPFAGSRGCIL